MKMASISMIQKVRRISTKGQLLVSQGDEVTPDTVIARGTVPNPEAYNVKIYQALNVDPEQVKYYMIKQAGEDVKKDEVIAIARSFFGRRTKIARSPIDGKIELFLQKTGGVLIRGHPLTVEVKAHVPGKVIELFPDEGAVIETKGIRLEGAFGVGGEALGELVTVTDSGDLPLTSDAIKPEHHGKVIVGGSVVTLDALREAERTGVKGIIVGGVEQKDLTYFLGYEIGVGITGNEDIGTTLIIMEGFGVNPLNVQTFRDLKGLEGRLACIDGTTQIRSRMLRPEIIVPF
jgi:hypothetical protein